MNYGFSLNLRDDDGDVYEECLLVHVGDKTIIKFKDDKELEEFAKRILGSLPEIKEHYSRSK